MFPKKPILRFLSALLLIAALAGCSSQKPTPQPEGVSEPLPEIDVYRYRLTVNMDADEGLEAKTYSAEDFPGVDCASVSAPNTPEEVREYIEDCLERGVEKEAITFKVFIVPGSEGEMDPEAEAEKLRAMEHVVSVDITPIEVPVPGEAEYYGVFSGCPVWIERSGLTAEHEFTVAGETFSDGNYFTINAAKDKLVYDLGEAFDKGFITEADVIEIARIHAGYVKNH